LTSSCDDHQDGADLEMNLNGSRYKAEDDDFDDMVFSEHQMSKIKKSEEISIEREKEIQQVNVCRSYRS
jgi:syntaxin 16